MSSLNPFLIKTVTSTTNMTPQRDVYKIWLIVHAIDRANKKNTIYKAIYLSKIDHKIEHGNIHQFNVCIFTP